MTKDEIIAMARQAGFEEHQAKFDTRFEPFAKLVADYVVPQTWVGLTDEERDEICLGDESIARAVEAKLRSKNT
jgi:hypothetical protein